MDHNRFDALVQSFGVRARRRSLLRLLMGFGLAGLVADAPDAGSRKRRRFVCKCRSCHQCAKHKRKCNPRPDGSPCGQGKACTNGECLCPLGFFPCDGACCADCGTGGQTATCVESCPSGSSVIDMCEEGASCCACDDPARRICNGACVEACPSGLRFNGRCECVAAG